MSLLEQLEAAGETCSPAFRAALAALEAKAARVEVLEAVIVRLEEKIGELERRLAQNSTNSSRPPSSDPPGVPGHQRPPKLRGQRKRGAQPGHEAHERSLVAPERVDRVVDHWPLACRACGQVFSLAAEGAGPERRQVIELPPVRVEVTEHRLHALCCPGCGATTKAASPADVAAATTFGPRLVALAAMLTVRLRASRRHLQQVLGDLLDVEPPSVGTLQHLLEDVSRALVPAYQEVRAAVRASPALGADETGWTKRQLRYWLWVVATATHSLYRLTRRRSAAEREKLLGRAYAGVVTSDRAGCYRGLGVERRQVCWAHLRRDFVAWTERGSRSAALGVWAVAETDRLFGLWHRFRRGEIARGALQRALRPIQARFSRLLCRAYHEGEPTVRRMADALLGLWEALWAFAGHEGTEPTNNESERALRAAVIWRKTSFGSQSERGLRLVERLLTVAETAKKQERDLLEYFTAAIAAHRLGYPAPALLRTP
ncbi:MAG TPA: IS66 family transposase [Gemmatimonadaceae bacterium]